MHRPQEQRHLAQADGHIAELRAQIDHQRKNLKRIAERGEPSVEKHREMIIVARTDWDLTGHNGRPLRYGL